MITLTIKEKGHLIEIPGMSPFRTPAKIDISKGDIRSIVGYLKVCSINDYEIVATDSDGQTEKYNARDFNTDTPKKVVKNVQKTDKRLTERIDRLEKVIEKLSKDSKDDSPKKVEQNTNQFEIMQRQILDAIRNASFGGGTDQKTISKEDDVAPFIPKIDVKGMKINSQGNTKTVKKDRTDTDDAADALSKLLGN
jgi:O6-methylguanine-DNA--protein-cysteine methyltransferase